MDKKKFIEQTAALAKNACELNIKRRREGLAEIGDDIDAGALKQNDIFAFGLRLAVDGIDSDNIEKTLNNMIDREQDENFKRLKIIQKEAVKGITEGLNSLTLCNILFSFLDKDEMKTLQGLLSGAEFKEYFKVF